MVLLSATRWLPGLTSTASTCLLPNYQTPRSLQMNFGFEHQLGKGVVWNADYIRNVGTHSCWRSM